MFQNNIFSEEVGAEKREKLVLLEFWPNGLLMPNTCKSTTHKKLEQAGTSWNKLEQAGTSALILIFFQLDDINQHPQAELL